MEKNKPDNLNDFFSLVTEEKKKKDEQNKELIGEISLETMFQDIAVETARVKKELQEKEKEKEEARKKLVADAKIFENFLFSEPQKKTKKKTKKDDYEELKQEIGSVDKPEKPAVEKVKEEKEETTAEQAIKILDTINEKTGKEIIKENTTESEIALLKRELDVLKQKVFEQGGGGSANLQHLDDISGISSNISGYNGKVLTVDLNQTGKFKHKKFAFKESSGVGTDGDIDTVGMATISDTTIGVGNTQLVVGGDARVTGILTVGTDSITLDGSNNLLNVGVGITIAGSGTITAGSVNASSASFTGDVSIGGTLTYEDVTSIDSVGLITARSGIDLGGSNIVRIEGVTSTKTSTTEASIDSFDAETYSAATYQVQVKRGSDYQTSSINLVHSGGTVYINEYGTIKTNESLASFDSDINSGNVRLLATPTSSSSTVFKVFRTTMNA